MYILFKNYFNCLLRCMSIVWLIYFVHVAEVSAQTVNIYVVKSSNRTEYELAINEIKSSLRKSSFSCSINEVLLNPPTINETDFWGNLIKVNRPDLIITVGTSASQSAIKNVRDIPVIFTMVLDNFEGLKSNSPSSNKNISGVTLAIPIQEQFDILLEAMPFVKRIGMIHSSRSNQVFFTAQKIAATMNLQLIAYEISSERDLPNALREILPEIDVLWMPPDVILYNDPNILRSVLRESFSNSVPTMAASKHLATAGAPFAIGIDYEEIGKQTADLALKRLSLNSISSPVIETPRRIILYINKRVLSSLGLTIPARVLEKAVSVESE